MARARKGHTKQSKNKGNQKKNLKRIKTTQEVLSNLKK
jgi:hypothetical protein